MDVRSLQALRSYGQTSQLTKPAPGAEDKKGGSFTDIAKSVASDIGQTLQTAESTASAALNGKADPHAVVEAMAAAEMTLETAVTIRDKVVEAYQEILRMPV
jgi:flagellar hook-basal body complex protein FliE